MTRRAPPQVAHRVRSRAATVALVAAVGLTAIKFAAAILSGSVGVFSESVHSLLDLVSAAVAFFAVREAGRPADEDHPFGHGKIETLSSLFEALLLIVAAAYIFWEGIGRLQNPQPLKHEGVAIAVIAFSMVASYFVYWHNTHAADATGSPAIRVNALHYLTDVVSSLGVLIGLILIQITDWYWIDPIMAFGIGGYILLMTVKELKRAFGDLIDAQLPPSEQARIEEIVMGFKPNVIRMHHLRTRRSGSTRHIDFHLLLCEKMTVKDGHVICDQIEERLEGEFPHVSAHIHVEPCSHVEEHEDPEVSISCNRVCLRDGSSK